MLRGRASLILVGLLLASPIAMAQADRPNESGLTVEAKAFPALMPPLRNMTRDVDVSVPCPEEAVGRAQLGVTVRSQPRWANTWLENNVWNPHAPWPCHDGRMSWRASLSVHLDSDAPAWERGVIVLEGFYHHDATSSTATAELPVTPDLRALLHVSRTQQGIFAPAGEPGRFQFAVTNDGNGPVRITPRVLELTPGAKLDLPAGVVLGGHASMTPSSLGMAGTLHAPPGALTASARIELIATSLERPDIVADTATTTVNLHVRNSGVPLPPSIALLGVALAVGARRLATTKRG